MRQNLLQTDRAKCRAKTRAGGKCERPAGSGTDHPGAGKCKLHGGATPIKHGLASSIERVRLADRIARHLANPDPLDLLSELALLRVIAEDLIERWESIYGVDGTLLAWHESFKASGNEPRPRQLPDLRAVVYVLDKVGAMVERIHRQRAGESLTVATLTRILETLGAEVVAAMKDVGLDEAQRTRLSESIEARSGAIRIEPEQTPGAPPSAHDGR